MSELSNKIGYYYYVFESIYTNRAVVKLHPQDETDAYMSIWRYDFNE